MNYGSVKVNRGVIKIRENFLVVVAVLIFWGSRLHAVAAVMARARSLVLLDVSGFASRSAPDDRSRRVGQ